MTLYDPSAEVLGLHLDGDSETAVDMALAMVRGYTRGVGFDPATGRLLAAPANQVRPLHPDLAAVVLAVAGRLQANPTGLRRFTTLGPYTEDVAGWAGFTVAEQQLMNRYRVRAL